MLRKLMPLWGGLSLWVIFMVLFGVQAIVVNSESWRTAAANAFIFWLLWVFFFPVVVWLALKFPFERGKLVAQIGIHVLAGVLIIATSQLIYRTIIPLPPPMVRPQPSDATSAGPASNPVGMRAAPDTLIYLVTLSICVAFAHYRESQKRERQALELQASLTQAKLQALRMQINPHFLFNTLNAISALVHSNPSVADEMITDLSELFRVSLESFDGNEIELSQELDLLGRYLAIEQRRFGGRLQVETKIAPEILNALVPTLILQPLVENAIRHGVEPKPSAGKIAICGSREGNRVKLSVSDSGSKPVNVTPEEAKRQGVGLTNTKARLQQLYGTEQSFSISQGELGGWAIEMVLPFKSPTKAG